MLRVPDLLVVAALVACASGPPRAPAPASGATPSALAAGHGRQEICTPGVGCNSRCAQGHCAIHCQPGSSCNASCSGGNCAQTCDLGASCTFSCSGGYCLQRCASISCRPTCTGGGCLVETGTGDLDGDERAH